MPADEDTPVTLVLNEVKTDVGWYVTDRALPNGDVVSDGNDSDEAIDRYWDSMDHGGEENV